MLEEVGGLINPGLFARVVRQALLDACVRIFEQTLVAAVAAGRTQVVVTAPDNGSRSFRARAVLATNAYSRELSISPVHLAARSGRV
jgi:glycine/D-amino acid oxidase-like deaminating enzyme